MQHQVEDGLLMLRAKFENDGVLALHMLAVTAGRLKRPLASGCQSGGLNGLIRAGADDLGSGDSPGRINTHLHLHSRAGLNCSAGDSACFRHHLH